MIRPGFLHTSPVHIATFDALLAELLPGVEAVHVVDEDLLSDAVASGPTAVADRVAARIAEMVDSGIGVLCCTCSTIGGVAEHSPSGVAVFRVDRPMAVEAVDAGHRIGVVAALASTLEPTRALLEEVAEHTGRSVAVTLVTVDGAWSLFEDGDQQGYVTAIAEAARELAGSVDVIVLAQASMAGAEPLLTDLAIPVLSSPRLAAAHLAAYTS